MKNNRFASVAERLRPGPTRFNIRVAGTLFGKLEYYGGLKIVTAVEGVNSFISTDANDDRSFLMWDFDDITLEALVQELTAQQWLHALSDIHILETGPGRYHAYCFTVRGWREVFHIVEDTSGVDPTYLKMSYVRGYFTLRFSDKSGREVERVATLKGVTPPDISKSDVEHYVRYLTKAG